MGIFSYATPEFTWEHLSPAKHSVIDTYQLKRQGFDLIFHEDSNWCVYKGRAIPAIFYSIDSTLSDDYHYKPRFEQAKRADLVLVDHDDLNRFRVPNANTRRLLYAVNDHLFKPAAKTLTVNFHCGGSPDRQRIRQHLHDICSYYQWGYKSGVVPLSDYAAQLSASKVVVNAPRTAQNRPHRVFDALACQSCLLSLPFPTVIEDGLMLDAHYVLCDMGTMEAKLTYLLDQDRWRFIAQQGYELVTQKHTWAVRARELRKMIYEELKL